jgi:CheY-like chemotaxis protein
MLRRFARAVTGSQASGDAYVMAALEALAADRATLQPVEPVNARLVLFGAFINIWGSIRVNGQVEDEPRRPLEAAADRGLAQITPLSRVAFLLRGLEGFSTAEIGFLLKREPAEVTDILDQAGREIASRISTDVLIIEDEPVIAMDLEAIVTALGHRVTHIARTHREAVAAIAEHQPGLVLADIRLADDSSGLDAVNEILQTCNLPVIFITAYPERLLTGERPEPTFLITKPFRTETVKAIISQALFFDRKAGLRADAVS